MDSFITVIINGKIMGLDMSGIERIIKLRDISVIPNSPGYLEGVIEYQNELIPVINVKKKLSLIDQNILPESSILIIAYGEERSGVIVDSINDIIEIDKKNILKNVGNQYSYGVIKMEKDVVNILKLENLIEY